MTPEQFCYWLQGYFEIANVNEQRLLSMNQSLVIQDHLNLVFNKKTPDRTIIEGVPSTKIVIGSIGFERIWPVCSGEPPDPWTSMSHRVCSTLNPDAKAYCASSNVNPIAHTIYHISC